MHVLGLDMSTCAGLAVVDSTTKKIVFAEEIQFKKQTGFERVNSIIAHVIDRGREYNAKCAIIEDYAISKFGGSAIVSIEIGTVLRFCYWQDDYPFLTVSPTSLKKFVTGKGNSNKDLMMLEVFKRWGYSSTTNNVADAVALALLGAYAISPDKKLRADSSVVISAALKSHPEFLNRVR